MGLTKKPKHLSAILKTEGNHRAKNDLDRLIEETAELATWCACAEIPMLSIYEKSGELVTNPFFTLYASKANLTSKVS